LENSLFDLKGKIALVTGSSMGLGLAIARGLARAGAIVALNGRNRERLASAAAELNGQGLTAHGFAFDVLQREQIEKQVSEIENKIGTIDILVNNVGNNLRGPLEDFDEATWHQSIDINLTRAWLVSKVVVKG
jgi:gluconate 5-dehydrogenase